MKRLILLWAALIILAFPQCKKDALKPESYIPPGPPPEFNSPPRVWLGENILDFPFTKILIDGVVSDPDYDIRNYHWRKISGPDFYNIEDDDSASTVISNLVNGNYEFELEVKDSKGLVGKDIVMVSVELKSENINEYIFNDLVWQFNWYSHLEIINFKYYIPKGRAYKIYIRRASNPEWFYVPIYENSSEFLYSYVIQNRPGEPGIYYFGILLLLYSGQDWSDTPSVKVVYR